jgi:hypothetical protein
MKRYKALQQYVTKIKTAARNTANSEFGKVRIPKVHTGSLFFLPELACFIVQKNLHPPSHPVLYALLRTAIKDTSCKFPVLAVELLKFLTYWE